MRILFVGATDVGSSDGMLLLGRALRRAGNEVRILPVTIDLPLMAHVALARAHVYDASFRASFNRHLLRAAATFEPHVVFLYGSNWCLLPATIRRLQRRHGCTVAIWELNQQLWKGFQAESLPLYDLVFALDSYFIPVLRVAGCRRVQHLPACADPEEHAPIVLSSEEEELYRSDVVFVGTGSAERAAILAELRHFDLKVYGVGWAGVSNGLASCMREEPVYGLKKRKIYGAARLSLNVHQRHMITGENFRVFEVAACGGLSISARKPDLVECLQAGEEVLVFDGPAELRAQAEYYLAHPDERDEIARAGRERVLAEHTYDHRARAILAEVSS